MQENRKEWCALQGLNLHLYLGKDPQASLIASQNSDLSPDLQQVVGSWPNLSQPLKDAILAIVDAGTKREGW
jgi:hypothetical protein